MSMARNLRRKQDKLLAKQVKRKNLPEANSLPEALAFLKALSSQLDDMQSALTQIILDRSRQDSENDRLRAVLIRMFVENRRRNPSQLLLGGKPRDPLHEVLEEVGQYQGEYDVMLALAQISSRKEEEA